MKTWLFAVLESVIALLGLAAYFFADNMVLAATAVVMAAGLGVFQSLHAAYQKQRLEAYQQQQFQKSVDMVDGQLQSLLDEIIAPPLPHRPTVKAVLQSRHGARAGVLLDEYDRAVHEIAAGGAKAESLAGSFADKIAGWSLGPYLRGLACLANNHVDAARRHFLTAQQMQSNWIAPWHGWATAAARQGRWDEIREHHPHINGVELLPYGAGDEQSFLELSEPDRESLVEAFQQAARSLGNYYTLAELSRSKMQMLGAQSEYLKAA